MANVYGIKTDIKLKNNALFTVNVLADDLSDAISSASYLKYNGEDLKKHIVSAVILVSDVLRDTWNIKDLNPNYKADDKAECKTYTDEDGNPLPTVG